MEETIFSKITKPYKDLMLQRIREFCAIDSVYDEDSKDKENPFGKGVTKALKYIQNVARNDGYEVNNYNNMVVEILIGKGNKNITIMAHADVVPVGTGWEHNPFDVFESGDYLYGRGVADDKGPCMSCYYALKALADNNMLGNYQVRFLVGGNEESGSLGMIHYFDELKKPQPTLGFSPDSDFPLIFAEKGILNFIASCSFKYDNIVSIEGGIAFNSVIEKCDVILKKDDGFTKYLTDNKIKFEVKNDSNITISFLGKAAHGSIPQEGINAGIIALNSLGDYYNISELKDIVNKYSDVYGRGINAYTFSEDMGENSLNVGLISYDGTTLKMTVNFRHVNTCSKEEIFERIVKGSYPIQVEEKSYSHLLYYPKDSTLISSLMHSYQEETGDYESKPLSTGGGTYAKEASNVVAFGMQFPGFESYMHSCKEQARISDLVKSMAIYARAIYELGRKLNEN